MKFSGTRFFSCWHLRALRIPHRGARFLRFCGGFPRPFSRLFCLGASLRPPRRTPTAGAPGRGWPARRAPAVGPCFLQALSLSKGLQPSVAHFAVPEDVLADVERVPLGHERTRPELAEGLGAEWLDQGPRPRLEFFPRAADGFGPAFGLGFEGAAPRRHSPVDRAAQRHAFGPLFHAAETASAPVAARVGSRAFLLPVQQRVPCAQPNGRVRLADVGDVRRGAFHAAHPLGPELGAEGQPARRVRADNRAAALRQAQDREASARCPRAAVRACPQDRAAR